MPRITMSLNKHCEAASLKRNKLTHDQEANKEGDEEVNWVFRKIQEGISFPHAFSFPTHNNSLLFEDPLFSIVSFSIVAGEICVVSLRALRRLHLERQVVSCVRYA